MVTSDHLCPWGIKAKDLLKRNGFTVEDHHLTSETANERYKKENQYDETPQIFVGDERIGGYDALREYLGKDPDPRKGQSYQPVLVVFAVCLLMAAAAALEISGTLATVRLPELFIALSMCVLSILKLQDLKSFATGFVQYDLIAQRFVPYAYIYAVVEGAGGVLMIAGLFMPVVAPAVLAVSTIGSISVIKAVYLERRDLNCACVGGGSSVPLGFLSLTENLMMMAMAIWMLVKSSL